MGSIALTGKIFYRVPPQVLASLGVAWTFQTLALFPGLTVAANIATGLTFQCKAWLMTQVLRLPGARAENAKVADRAPRGARRLDLTPHLGKPVSTLPYGLQERVEQARALVAEPHLLLLDEPMAGMTATEKAEMGVQISLSLIVLKAPQVLVLGRFDLVLGAIVARLVVAPLQSRPRLVWAPFVGGGFEGWLAYAVALVVLLLRPSGLFGQKLVERF